MGRFVSEHLNEASRLQVGSEGACVRDIGADRQLESPSITHVASAAHRVWPVVNPPRDLYFRPTLGTR